MGLTFWDAFKTVAPIAASFTPLGPVGGIVVGGLLGAGEGIAKDEGIKGALLRGGLGAGTGAIGAGIGSSISSGAAKAGTKLAEKAAGRAILEQTAKEGALKFGALGMPQFSQQALGAGAAKLAAPSAASRALTGIGDLTKNARLSEKQEALLNMVGKGSQAVGAVGQAFQPAPRSRPTFADLSKRIPSGYSGMYQYSPGRTRTINFMGGGYY